MKHIRGTAVAFDSQAAVSGAVAIHAATRVDRAPPVLRLQKIVAGAESKFTVHGLLVRDGLSLDIFVIPAADRAVSDLVRMPVVQDIWLDGRIRDGGIRLAADAHSDVRVWMMESVEVEAPMDTWLVVEADNEVVQASMLMDGPPVEPQVSPVRFRRSDLRDIVIDAGRTEEVCFRMPELGALRGVEIFGTEAASQIQVFRLRIGAWGDGDFTHTPSWPRLNDWLDAHGHELPRFQPAQDVVLALHNPTNERLDMTACLLYEPVVSWRD